MKFFTAIRYCIIHIAHDWLRTLLTIISVAAIISVYLLSGGLIKNLDKLGDSYMTFPNSLLLAMSTNAVFMSDSYITMDDLDYYAALINDQYGKGTVKELIPMIYRTLYLDGNSIMVTGVNYKDLIDITRLSLIEGTWPINQSELLVNQEFISITGYKIGDTFPLYGADMTIAGIAISPLWRNAMVVLSYDQAFALYDTQDSFQLGVIQLTDDADPILIHKSIGSIQEDANCCNLYLHDHFNLLILSAFKGIGALSHVLQVLAFILITFGAYNAAAMTLAEHRLEIILLRVLGFSNKAVYFILFLRTLIVMLISFLIGWGIAILFGNTVTQANEYSFSGVPIVMDIGWKEVLISLCIIFLLTLLGTYISSHNRDALKQGGNFKAFFQGKVG